ncbi:hypothetical protein Y032_0085g1877 [Ancylostoma ceylanicum]|uniref:Major sperm protein n=1 Tax=Ancylostoma ceylanicum TaxID=53326 RepID=A0A016TQA2_9BILA|nr:hypothetical protein Y032_0085g1877 [Ancylostoma ceylanicum]
MVLSPKHFRLVRLQRKKARKARERSRRRATRRRRWADGFEKKEPKPEPKEEKPEKKEEEPEKKEEEKKPEEPVIKTDKTMVTEENKEEEKKDGEKDEQKGEEKPTTPQPDAEKKESDEKKDEKEGNEEKKEGAGGSEENPAKFSKMQCEWDEKGGKQTITVTNTTDTRMGMKIKTSDNTLFRVEPVFANIEPGKALEVAVTRSAGTVKEDKIVILLTQVHQRQRELLGCPINNDLFEAELQKKKRTKTKE